MATYKVLQDIEAEDKFLGPLTLKQFIYGAITIVSCYLSFIGFTKGTWVVAAVLSPVILFGGFLAWPWGKDQSTEVWLLAKVRFFLKPRRRIWDQNGMKQLVNIVAPKHVEQVLTNGLSQTEVKSRLHALANTIDSRGWAVKNASLNLYSTPSYIQYQSDRLVDPSTLPQDVPGYDITPGDDIMDEQSNPTAQNFNSMINTSSKAHRQQAMTRMQQAATEPATVTGQTQTPSADYWFINQPAATPAGYTSSSKSQVVVPSPAANSSKLSSSPPLLPNPPTTDEPVIVKSAAAQAVEPLDLTDSSTAGAKGTTATKSPTPKAQATSTPTPGPVILELANNDDLNVATIARQADRAGKEPPQDEVVISLR